MKALMGRMSAVAVAGLLASATGLAACGGTGAGAAEERPDTIQSVQPRSPAEIEQEAQPMTPEEAEQMGVVDTTIQVTEEP